MSAGAEDVTAVKVFKNSSEANHEQPIQIALQHVREQESVISLARREGTDCLW